MRRVGIVAGVLVGAAIFAAQAIAAESPTIVEANPGVFPDRGYVLTLPARQALSAGQVKVTENGNPVDGLTVIPAGAANGGFATILLIDASNSMKGAPIKDAMAAGRAFAAKQPPNASVGVIVFNKNADVRVAPTRDKAAVQSALATLPALARGNPSQRRPRSRTHPAPRKRRQGRVDRPPLRRRRRRERHDPGRRRREAEERQGARLHRRARVSRRSARTRSARSPRTRAERLRSRGHRRICSRCSQTSAFGSGTSTSFSTAHSRSRTAT